MNNKKTLIAAFALTFTMASVSLSTAHEPEQHGQMADHQMNGQMMPQGMMHGDMMATLTADQQKEVIAIEAKYAEDLETKEMALHKKGAELSTALNDETTTIATVKRLRTELAGLEQEYWQLRQEINQEIGTKIGTTYYGENGMGPENCPMHQSGMMVGQGMMMGQGMMAGNMQGRHCR